MFHAVHHRASAASATVADGAAAADGSADSDAPALDEESDTGTTSDAEDRDVLCVAASVTAVGDHGHESMLDVSDLL